MKYLKLLIKMLILAPAGVFAASDGKEYFDSWWMRGDEMVVECRGSRESYPWLGEIKVRGKQVTIQIYDQSKTWLTQVSQPNFKVWTHREMKLSVRLRESRYKQDEFPEFANLHYHVGTLELRTGEYATSEDVSLWCFPEKDAPLK